MRCGWGRGEGEGDGGEKDLKYAKIISDNAHVRHSPRSCLKCQKLCAASPRGSISGKGRVSWGVAGGEGGGRKVPLIGTWHAFVLECIFCSYLDAGPAGKTELCQERERELERGRQRGKYRETELQLPFFLHVSCMLKYYPCRQKRATSFFKSLCQLEGMASLYSHITTRLSGSISTSAALSLSLSHFSYIELSRVKEPRGVAWQGVALNVALSCAKFANFLIKISAP